MAVAVAIRSPGTAARHSSPTKSPTERSDSELGAAILKIENRVGGISLGKEDLLRLQSYEFSSQASIRQKRLDVKWNFLKGNHATTPFRMRRCLWTVQRGTGARPVQG
jgi:hypothetical protein